MLDKQRSVDMPSISEGQANPLQATLQAGIDVLSQHQEIVFTQYHQLVLPTDGCIFWAKTVNTMAVQGSLHFSGDQSQSEDETLGMSHIIFSSEKEINAFTNIEPATMWIGEYDGTRFAFNHKKNFYQQSGLWHYMGDAIYAAMSSQFLESAADFDNIIPVVSNSLPIFLALNKFFPIYPSFLVPANTPPPYAVVHIDPASTQAIQSAPLIDSFSAHHQLATDEVKITIYGERNTSALDFQDYLFQNSVDSDDWGLMNCPVIQDEKRTQSEYGIIAQKKTFTMKVSYYQTRANDIARQLILSSIVKFYPLPQ